MLNQFILKMEILASLKWRLPREQQAGSEWRTDVHRPCARLFHFTQRAHVHEFANKPAAFINISNTVTDVCVVVGAHLTNGNH